MSEFEDIISGLEFEPSDGPLRDLALAAYRQTVDRHRDRLTGIARDRLYGVLGVPLPDDAKVDITSLRDGDGRVTFTIDRLRFRVTIVYPTGHDGDAEPTTIALAVKDKGQTSNHTNVSSLEDLGRLLSENKVHIDSEIGEEQEPCD